MTCNVKPKILWREGIMCDIGPKTKFLFNVRYVQSSLRQLLKTRVVKPVKNDGYSRFETH